MLDSKVVEIRDEGTHIGGLAIKMASESAPQRAHLRRHGYPANGTCIVLMKLGNQEASSDPYFWSSRTMQVAHDWITNHYDEIHDGDVIDVQFIVGETQQPKTAEAQW